MDKLTRTAAWAQVKGSIHDEDYGEDGLGQSEKCARAYRCLDELFAYWGPTIDVFPDPPVSERSEGDGNVVRDSDKL